ncbi:hypothetical protein CBM2608_B30111 [Cupriavidus taiwanensis]|nr:hypothetical protein CBM2608_B30111 [Cupriavidus taiwanensis]
MEFDTLEYGWPLTAQGMQLNVSTPLPDTTRVSEAKRKGGQRIHCRSLRM